MTQIDERGPGYFCWPELATTDRAAAKRFYPELFGWSADEAGGGPPYTMWRLHGLDVGAACDQDPKESAAGRPVHWSVYVSVASADAAAARALELGGTVLGGPFEVLDAGRMAILQDPTGAVACAWQARAHIGARIVDQPGALCWTELETNDVARAAAFYAGLFAWQPKPSSNDGEYTELWNAGQPIGGMLAIKPEQGKASPQWITYFAVDDCDATVARAQELGGRVRMPAKDMPHVGRFAQLIDPQGAVFAVIQLASPPA